MSKAQGPDFLKYCLPILDALNQLGGSGQAAEVTDLVIKNMGIPEEEQEVANKNGESRVRNAIAWARFYMVKGGLVSSSQRGVWGLTEKGRQGDFDHKKIHEMFIRVRDLIIEKRKTKESEEIENAGLCEDDQRVSDQETNYKTELLATLRELPPEGFERICQRVLRESGFQQVVVTGRSGDGGIDGHGILQINPLVSFKVLFQCKRYQGAVSVSAVRDFRGAMQGRAEKGIILTTGSFTTDAKNESIRDGATPIELVDGEELVDMFCSLSLGLKPRQIFEVDQEFFNQFR